MAQRVIEAVAIAVSDVAPDNTEVIWYDTSITDGFNYEKVKIYNRDSNSWVQLSPSDFEVMQQIKNVDGNDSGLNANFLQGYTAQELIDAATAGATLLSTGQLLVGQADGVGLPKTLAGDATIDVNGNLVLANSGVSAGTYSVATVTVDAKGRITNISAGSAGNLSNTNLTQDAANRTYTLFSGGDLKFLTSGGSEILVLDESNVRVGVGVAVPTEALDVNGAIKIGSAAGTVDGTLAYGNEGGSTSFWARISGAWVNLAAGDNISNANLTWAGNTTQDLNGNTLGFINGSTGFGTASPNASAIVDLSSTDKGLLLPRMTTAQMNAISAPATDLLIWNTDLDSMYRYDGANWVALSSGYGIVSVNDSNGQPTFYASFQSAINAASSGDVVSLHSNITETTDTTVTLKRGVKINGNNYTYTLDFNSATSALTVPSSIIGDRYYINNLIVKRVNGTTSSYAFDGFSPTVNGVHFHMDGSRFFNTNGDALDCGNGNYLYNVYASTDLSSALGIVCGNSSSTLYNCIGEGVGVGIQTAGGDNYNCIGISSGNDGLRIRGGFNCYGYSSAAFGINCINANNSFFSGCTGESDADSGFRIRSSLNTKFHNCTGKSTAGIGIEADASYNNWEMYNSYGYSTSSVGIRGGRLYNCVGVSDAAAGGEGLYGNGVYNCVFRSNLNSSSGHAFSVRGGGFDSDVINCTLIVTNASAYAINQSFSTGTYNIANNTYIGCTTAVDPTGITQGITNTFDLQGNILL